MPPPTVPPHLIAALERAVVTPLSDVEAEALGRRWLAAGGVWREGMIDGLSRVRTHHATGRSADIRYRDINWEWVEEPVADTAWPDLRDAATRGAALEVVRERWGTTAHLVRLDTHERQEGERELVPACWWALAVGLASVPFLATRPDGTCYFLAGRTEAEALVAALEARHAL